MLQATLQGSAVERAKDISPQIGKTVQKVTDCILKSAKEQVFQIESIRVACDSKQFVDSPAPTPAPPLASSSANRLAAAEHAERAQLREMSKLAAKNKKLIHMAKLAHDPGRTKMLQGQMTALLRHRKDPAMMARQKESEEEELLLEKPTR
jgi:hypothetical protein